jgi:hypothetical protein
VTWQQVAEPHLRCRLTFETVGKLKCHDHNLTLLLPLRAEQPRSGPPPYRRPNHPGRPMPTGLKERVAAEIAARKRMKDQTPDEGGTA